MTDDSPLTFSLSAVSRKKVIAPFDGGRLSSDSGVILLSLAERRRVVARTLAALIDDPRDLTRITHTVEDVLRASGAVRALRFYVTHDCGQIINPDGLKNQIEGNVIQTVSRTLINLDFDRSAVTSVDWVTYPILTFPKVPDIVIELIDRPSEKPWGAGEPSTAVTPSAISNAIFDATGVRMRSVPFTPEKVKLALGRAA